MTTVPNECVVTIIIEGTFKDRVTVSWTSSKRMTSCLKGLS